MENEKHEKLEENEMPINEYRCRKCEHRFFQPDDEVPYCPACDCEEVEVIFQELKGGNK